MRPGKALLIWEAALTFATFTASGIGLVDVVSGKTAALLVLVVQGLNAATIVYKTGQWNPTSQTTSTRKTSEGES